MSKLIQVAAIAVFAQFPTADEVYVTEDGNAFLPQAKQLAENHARQAGLPAPVKVLRSECDVPKQVKDARTEQERRSDEEAEAARQRIADEEAAAAAQKEAEEKAAADKVKADEDAAAAAPKGVGKSKSKGKGK